MMLALTEEIRVAWKDARGHITKKFGGFARAEFWNSRRCLDPGVAVEAVELARESGREVQQEDLRAALSLIPAARRHLDAVELGLIDGAREAGMSWEEIGGAMYLGDRRQAQQRRSRLKDRLNTGNAS
jgi:hypothetical protein